MGYLTAPFSLFFLVAADANHALCFAHYLVEHFFEQLEGTLRFRELFGPEVEA